jgi:Zn-dependent protease
MVVFAAVLLVWVFSLCLHEYAHARVAFAGGDETVAHKGYLDFNPIRYMDPVNSLILPIVFLAIGFLPLPGGAVWIDRSRLRSRGWETGVSLAGPLANLAFLAVLALPFQIGVVDPGVDGPAWNILAFSCLLQAVAAFLNLLPLPGLDGFGALEPWLPHAVREATRPYRGYAMFILFVGTDFDDRLFGLCFRLLDALAVPLERVGAGMRAFQFWN